MAIPEDRLSTTFVDGDVFSPDERIRPTLLEDYELGPMAISDTSAGLTYQSWTLSYVSPDITLTPETTGPPVVPYTKPGCTQLTFCFDQNARPTFAYVIGGNGFLYWYDTDAAQFVETEYTGLISVFLMLDDKRATQTGANDMIFWYTRLTGPSEYSLYHRKQRERFETEYLMKTGCLPFFSRGGMHDGFRIKLMMRAGIG
jgi:hypothetical protein